MEKWWSCYAPYIFKIIFSSTNQYPPPLLPLQLFSLVPTGDFSYTVLFQLFGLDANQLRSNCYLCERTLRGFLGTTSAFSKHCCWDIALRTRLCADLFAINPSIINMSYDSYLLLLSDIWRWLAWNCQSCTRAVIHRDHLGHQGLLDFWEKLVRWWETAFMP